MEHDSHQTPEMHSRRTKMEDGRYLLYYTFGEKTSPDQSKTQAEKDEPQAVPVATEEAGV